MCPRALSNLDITVGRAINFRSVPPDDRGCGAAASDDPAAAVVSASRGNVSAGATALPVDMQLLQCVS